MVCGKRQWKLQWKRTCFYALFLIYGILVLFALFNRTTRLVYNMPDDLSKTEVSNTCVLDTTELGIADLDLSVPNGKKLEEFHKSVSFGGHWQPNGCTPVQHIAIIIPHRNRKKHLLVLLRRLHTLMQMQKLSYHIFVIEQWGKEEFNRGRLLNVGVTEALNRGKFDCFIFHDVDLIPEHDGNLYMCDNELRHLASAIDEMRYHVMYNNYAGGVVAVNHQNILAMNGYSNDFWGWGSEDDDFSARSIGAALLLTRPPESIGRYKMVKHHKQWRSNNGYDIFLTWRSRWKTDGLSNIKDKYKFLSEEQTKLYTNITVDLGLPKELQYQHLPKESFWWFLQFFFP